MHIYTLYTHIHINIDTYTVHVIIDIISTQTGHRVQIAEALHHSLLAIGLSLALATSQGTLLWKDPPCFCWENDGKSPFSMGKYG